jgi:hypothetical protein
MYSATYPADFPTHGTFSRFVEHVLRFGGTVLTANYLLSPTCLARRNPLLRPLHYNSELEAQLTNSEGLNERHKEALALLISSG